MNITPTTPNAPNGIPVGTLSYLYYDGKHRVPEHVQIPLVDQWTNELGTYSSVEQAVAAVKQLTVGDKPAAVIWKPLHQNIVLVTSLMDGKTPAPTPMHLWTGHVDITNPNVAAIVDGDQVFENAGAAT